MEILIIDDEPDTCKSLASFLGKLGHRVTCASDGIQGLHAFHSHDFNLVITDLRMPEMDGLELLRRIKVVDQSPVDVIVVTGHGDMDNAIKALKYGAFDYLPKPINVRELAIILERSAEYAALRQNYLSLKREFKERLEIEKQLVRGEAARIRAAYLEEIGLDGLCVYSEAMRNVINQAEKYSSDRTVPVLIEGESGTGKELIARYVHHFGQGNAVMPFIAVNCGALSQELIEGELFGHEPGAYTGATRTGRMGKLEAANGGTIFFDEIGEMPLKLQVKLLRVLEEKNVSRLGGVKEIPIDVRIICATNKDIQQAVYKKQFRLDLYYRINVGIIHIPPIRERTDDILPLAYRFIKRAFSRKGKRFECLTPKAEAFLLNFYWPGNVRQLKNAMERLAIMKTDGEVDSHDLSFVKDLSPNADFFYLRNPVLGKDSFDLPEKGLDLEALERQTISRALEKNQGNQTYTAKYLGISRRVLQGKMKRMGLS